MTIIQFMMINFGKKNPLNSLITFRLHVQNGSAHQISVWRCKEIIAPILNSSIVKIASRDECGHHLKYGCYRQ